MHPQPHRTTQTPSHSVSLNPASRTPGIVYASGDTSLHQLSLEDRAKLLSGVSEWIVNRSGISGKPKPLRIDPVHAVPGQKVGGMVAGAMPVVVPVKAESPVSAKSVPVDGGKVQRIDRVDTLSAGRVVGPKTLSSVLKFASGGERGVASPLSESVQSVRRSIHALEARLKGSGPTERKQDGPRVWRRWIAFDSVWETRAAIWRSKASRYGLALDAVNEFPSGQQIWTDIDLILNVVDGILGTAIAASRSGGRLRLEIRQDPEDHRWLLIVIKANAIEAAKQAGLRLQFARQSVSPSNREYATSPLQKRISLLGGYVDQLESREQGTAWKIHLPADDLLGWLERAMADELMEVTEVVLESKEVSSQELLIAQGMDRAFQGTLAWGQRAILMTPRRYLVASLGKLQDRLSIEKRYQVQLAKLSLVDIVNPAGYTLQMTELGSLGALIQRIRERLGAKQVWEENRGVTGKERPMQGDLPREERAGSAVHAAHGLRGPRELETRSEPRRVVGERQVPQPKWLGKGTRAGLGIPRD